MDCCNNCIYLSEISGISFGLPVCTNYKYKYELIFYTNKQKCSDYTNAELIFNIYMKIINEL